MSTPSSPAIALVVHGHFYQPPRENPWTDEVPREPSAAPAHDWNERILAECYRANAFARLYGPRDSIRALVNNYAQISFNVGPTLARWIVRRDPTTMARMHAGDQEQRQRLGHGGALAQVWGHPIAPLLSPRDRRTQIRWGLQDFQRCFHREAEGIWLPETGVDPATLEALIEAGITHTILAPEQIAAVRAPGGTWTPVTRDTVDTGRAYRWLHGDGSGRSIALCVFDGPLSREIAFGTATRDSESFLAHVKASAARSQAGRRLVLAASDGELYGHHKKFADLMLAHATTVEAAKQGVAVTNLAAFLAAEPPTWEAELAKGPSGEGTAWSCAHGLGRWQRHCGCAMRSPAESGWSQAWRTPLRAAFDRLRDRAAAFYQDAAGDLFADPWEVRDAYGAVLDDPVPQRQRFLRLHGKPSLRRGKDAAVARAALLLELQRSTLMMYASCGWFFDDVAGIESAICIRQAAYVLDQWKRLGGTPPTKELLDRLAEAKSNLPQAGTGADVFRRVSAHRTTAAHAVAAVALAELTGATGSLPGTTLVPGFAVDAGHGQRKPRVKGKATVQHLRTGETATLAYEARSQSALVLTCKAGKETIALSALPDEAREPIALALLARLVTAPHVSVKDCQRALELARTTGAAGDRTSALYHPAFADLLPRLLEEIPAGSATDDAVSTLAEVLDAVPEATRTEAVKRAQEWAWQGLQLAASKRKPPSLALRAFAEKLGLAVDAILAAAKAPA